MKAKDNPLGISNGIVVASIGFVLQIRLLPGKRSGNGEEKWKG